MKKIMIILITLIIISVLNADVYSRAILDSIANSQLELTKIHFNGLLQSTIEFSQEDYDVGDIIEITIHFEVNTAKNVENLKFAVTDYKNKILYVLVSDLDTVTPELVEGSIHGIMKDNGFPFIESDPDLVLSNDKPKGVYHLKFKLTKKVNCYNNLLGKVYPYINRDLDLYSYTKAEKYEYITDYKGPVESLTIPIKINPAARKNEKSPKIPEIKSIPADKPKREFNKKQSNSSIKSETLFERVFLFKFTSFIQSLQLFNYTLFQQKKLFF